MFSVPLLEALFSETALLSQGFAARARADAAFKMQVLRWFHPSTFGDLIGDLGGLISNHRMREENGISSLDWLHANIINIINPCQALNPLNPPASFSTPPTPFSPPYMKFLLIVMPTTSVSFLWDHFLLLRFTPEFITIETFPFLSNCVAAGVSRSEDVLPPGVSPALSSLIFKHNLSPSFYLPPPISLPDIKESV